MTLLIIIFLPITLYFILFFLLYLGWVNRCKPVEHNIYSTVQKKNFSIIIPVRNEENNILRLLSAIGNQNYPKLNFEIIIIDDHSSDNTIKQCEIFFQHNTINHKIIKLNPETNGKKAAQKIGIENAQNDIIILTDADCVPCSNWLYTFNNYYLKHHPKLMIGPVIMQNLYKKNNIFSEIITLEHLSLMSVSEASSCINRPIMCSSANLAFEKEIFFEYIKEEISKHPSGDDMFLLMYVKKKYNDKIKYINTIDSIVYTLPPKNFKEFVQQRIRWASKSKYYKDFEIITVATLVFTTSLSIIIILMKSIFVSSFFIYYIIALIIKSVPDYLLLNKITSQYNIRSIMKWFCPTQLIYPFYIVFIGIYSIFGKFKWKSRKFNAR